MWGVPDDTDRFGVKVVRYTFEAESGFTSSSVADSAEIVKSFLCEL